MAIKKRESLMLSISQGHVLLDHSEIEIDCFVNLSKARSIYKASKMLHDIVSKKVMNSCHCDNKKGVNIEF